MLCKWKVHYSCGFELFFCSSPMYKRGVTEKGNLILWITVYSVPPQVPQLGTAETDCLTNLLLYVHVLCSVIYSVVLNVCWFLVVYSYTRNMEQTQNGRQTVVVNLMGSEVQYQPCWLLVVCVIMLYLCENIFNYRLILCFRWFESLILTMFSIAPNLMWWSPEIKVTKLYPNIPL
jgi:hypothetical protein